MTRGNDHRFTSLCRGRIRLLIFVTIVTTGYLLLVLDTKSASGLLDHVERKEVTTAHQGDGSSTGTTGNHRILLITALFSERAVNKLFLRLFLESATTAGVDILLLGDPVPTFKLPGTNIRHHHMTWEEFLTIANNRMFDGRPVLDHMKNNASSVYKVVDFKPIFGHLFPDLVRGYEFWGHCDNDMLLGNATNFVYKHLDNNDIISASVSMNTYGPFTLYRNIPLVNEVFRKSEISLEELFNSSEANAFDEVGNLGPWMDEVGSMSRILDKYADDLGIRIHHIFWKKLVNDGNCGRKNSSKHDFYYPFHGRCAECIYDREYQSGNGYSLLVHRWKDQSLHPVLLCHYRTRKMLLENSLQANRTMFEKLLGDHAFSVDIKDGFRPLNESRNVES